MPDRPEKWWLRLHTLARGIDSRVPVEWVAKRATVSNRNRYCYFRLPKCANSTVIRTLASYDPSLAGRAGEEGDVQKIKSQSGGLFSARAASSKTFARKYCCFTVVRNPFIRVLSAYLDKIAVARPGQYRYVADGVGRQDIRSVSFSDFVAFLENGGLYMNAHWAPQVSLLPLDPESLAFIGFQERLDRDMASLIEDVLMLGKYRGILCRDDRRRHASDNLPDFYTHSLMESVQRLYQADFQAFGYCDRIRIANDKA